MVDERVSVQEQLASRPMRVAAAHKVEIRIKVARHPYNKDLVRNEDRDVSDVPPLGKGRTVEDKSTGAASWEWIKDMHNA